MSDRWIMYVTTNHKTWINRLTEEEFKEVFDKEGQKILNWGAPLARPSGGTCVDLVNSIARLRNEIDHIREGGMPRFDEECVQQALDAPDGCGIDDE